MKHIFVVEEKDALVSSLCSAPEKVNVVLALLRSKFSRPSNKTVHDLQSSFFSQVVGLSEGHLLIEDSL